MNRGRLEKYFLEEGRVVRELTVGTHVWRSCIENIAEPTTDGHSAWWQSFLRGAMALGEERVPAMVPIRSVDAFCGCGGLTLGSTQAAIAVDRRLESVAAIDVDEGALEVHQANFGTKHILNVSVSSLVDFHITGTGDGSRFAYSPEVIEPTLVGEVGKIDLFLAGPPCQGHSNLNNKTRREDPRNLLYLTAVALAAGLRAKALVLENVPDIVNDRSGVVVAAKALLKNAGYCYIDSGVLSTDELGGAQTRKRFFLIASLGNTKMGALTFKEITSCLKNSPKPLSWAIGDLVNSTFVLDPGIMDAVPALSEDNLVRINHLFKNDLYDLPDEERPDCHKNGNTYPAVYGRLRWDRPAGTITTGFSSPGRGRYVHPIHPRVITPHEAARIQTFPDSFRFVVKGKDPSRSSLSKWIGDAVPPLLGYAAALPLLMTD